MSFKLIVKYSIEPDESAINLVNESKIKTMLNAKIPLFNESKILLLNEGDKICLSTFFPSKLVERWIFLFCSFMAFFIICIKILLLLKTVKVPL